MFLAGLLAAGVILAVYIIIGWSITVLDQRFHRDGGIEEQVVLKNDGTPLVETQIPEEAVKFRQIDGKVLSDDEAAGLRDHSLLSAQYLLGHQPAENEKMSEHDWTYRIVAFNDTRELKTIWYFVHDGESHGRGYFEFYDINRLRRIGFIGVHGFQADEPAEADRIPVAYWRLFFNTAFVPQARLSYGEEASVYGDTFHYRYLFADKRIIKVDFRDRSLKPLYDRELVLDVIAYDPTEEMIRNVRRENPKLLIRTNDRVSLIDAQGKEVDSFIIPAEHREGGLEFFRINDTQAAILTSTTKRGHNIKDVDWIDRSGKVLRHETISLNNPPPEENLRLISWASVAMMGSPPLAALLAPLAVVKQEKASIASYRRGLPIVLPAIGVITLVAAGSGSRVCYRRQRRYAEPWTAAWVAFVFLLGLPGLIGYICHRRWPAMAACTTCRAVVPQDRPQCCRCGTEFSSPQLRGIEIFESSQI